MRNDPLSVQSMEFAVSIINLVKDLKLKHESVISNQIGRSGTSVSANIREAQYAHGKADFVASVQIRRNYQADRRQQEKLPAAVFCL